MTEELNEKSKALKNETPKPSHNVVVSTNQSNKPSNEKGTKQKSDNNKTEEK